MRAAWKQDAGLNRLQQETRSTSLSIPNACVCVRDTLEPHADVFSPVL